MDRADIEALRVIDADSHVTEPPDVWTSRLPKRLLPDAPRVDLNPTTGAHHWRVGDTWLTAVGTYARAGWTRFPPDGPREYDQIDPGTWRAEDRLRRLDEYGIHAQVLHPNVIAMEIESFLAVGPEFATACALAYNDFVSDFASADRDRLLPTALIPFWDLPAAVSEVHRAAETGHHGVLFANDYGGFGLPDFTDHHWDPVFAAAQDVGLPVVTHVGFCSSRAGSVMRRPAPATASSAAQRAFTSSMALLGMAEYLAKVVTSGLCERFPRLRFVSIESGIGYVNYLLESLDWNWRVHGAHRSELLPSEYFRRQCYATFWFETAPLRLLDTYPDSFMFQTDYPHQNSLSPGPVSPAQLPSTYLSERFGGVPEDLTRKALHDNAARVYAVSG